MCLFLAQSKVMPGVSIVLVFVGWGVAFFFNSGLFYVWLGMEISSFGVVVFLVSSMLSATSLGDNYFFKSKSLFKYFFIQMTAGASLLMVILCMKDLYYFDCLVFFLLMMKVSAFPGYSWLIELYSNLTYFQIFLVGIVPKVVPFYLLWVVGGNSTHLIWAYILIIFLTFVVSLASGLKSSNVRYIVAFSSMMNLSWMLFSIMFGFSLFMLVLVYYGVVSFSVYKMLEEGGLSSVLVQSSTSPYFSDFSDIWFGGLMFVMSGLPLGIIFTFKFLILMSFFEDFSYSCLPAVILLMNNLFLLVYVRMGYLNLQKEVIYKMLISGVSKWVSSFLFFLLSFFLFFSIVVF